MKSNSQPRILNDELKKKQFKSTQVALSKLQLGLCDENNLIKSKSKQIMKLNSQLFQY